MGASTRQFEILNTVHGFHLKLLKKILGHDVAVPGRIERLRTTAPEELTPAGLQLLREWLALLDLAITPLMMRDALKDSANRETAEALICHYCWKSSGNDSDRDKTDFIATYLYRNPRTPGDWEITVWRSEDAPVPVPPFEIALRKLTGQEGELPLPEEHRQLAREFEFFTHEVEDYRHFDDLMDSGLMQRVRDVKEALGRSFYHPHVLASVAAYNSFFGQHFDHLFHAATRDIKNFADKVQQEGGSIMSRVDRDVIVKQLADVQETKILEAEYQKAQEQFQRVSRYKKAVDSRRGRSAGQGFAATPGNSGHASAPNTSAASAHGGFGTPPTSPAAGMSASLEDSKVQAMEESIQHFIRAADSKLQVQVVPLRHGNLGLLPPEVEAYRVDYLHEKSFRADYARVLIRVVALMGRMAGELVDYRSKQNSAYLWKPHADSLAHLLRASQRTIQHGQELMNIARQRGLTDKVNAINGSLQRLREQVQTVAKALQVLGAAGS